MSASPSRTAVLEEGWLPFQISDLWCAGDRRSRPSAVDLPTRPLEGLALHLPAPIPFTASYVHGTIRRLGGKIVPIEGEDPLEPGDEVRAWCFDSLLCEQGACVVPSRGQNSSAAEGIQLVYLRKAYCGTG